MGDLVLLPIKPDPQESYLATLQGGASTMAGCLKRIQALAPIPWESWTYADAVAVRAQLKAQYKPGTLNKHLSALRGVLKEAGRLYPERAPALFLAASIKGEKFQRLPKGREIPLPELAKLIQAGNARDKALLAIMYGAGLRESEICDLDLSDWQDSCLLVRDGKGNKTRRVPVGSLKSHIETWLRTRGMAPGALLHPLNRLGQPIPRRMSRRGVYEVLEGLCAKCLIPRYHPHDLRHTYITQLRRGGVDIALRKALAGHADISTTALYDVNNVDELRAAANLLPVP